MRQIKFRGKTKVGNEWIYGTTISQGTIKRKANMWYMEVAENKWKGLQPDSLGQFTGLEDKGGKEIYEGDILYAVNSRIPPFYQNGILYRGMGGKFEVVYLGCGFYLKNKDGHCIEFLSDWEYEVIGNIYDNPELVEE